MRAPDQDALWQLQAGRRATPQTRLQDAATRTLGVGQGSGPTCWPAPWAYNEVASPARTALDAWLSGATNVIPEMGRAPAVPTEEPPRGNRRHDIYYAGNRAVSIQELLGEEHFERPESPKAEDPAKLRPVRDMVRAVGLKSTSGLRQWIAQGIIPDAGTRGPGNRRMYTHAQVEGIRRIALEEGLHSTPRANVNFTDFAERAFQHFRDLEVINVAPVEVDHG